MTSSPSSDPALLTPSKIPALVAELARETEAALGRLEGEALAAFRAGDAPRILALVDERARLGELAASLGRFSGATTPAPAPAPAPVAAPPIAPATPPLTPPVVPPVALPVALPIGLPIGLPPTVGRERFAAREEKLPAPAPVPAPETTPSEPAPPTPAKPEPRPAPKPVVEKPAAVKPAVEKAPKPARLPKPVPEGPLDGKRLAETRARFFEESRALLAVPSNGPPALRAARLKSAISLGRALGATPDDAELARLVNDELKALREAWNEDVPHDFFGLNPGRFIEAEGWYRLARAFALTAEAEEARPALADETAAGASRDAAADTFAAIVGLAKGTMGHYAEGTGDAEVQELWTAAEGLERLARVKEIQSAIRRKPADWPRYEEMATGLPALAKRLKTEGERRAKQEAALEDFERELKEGAADEDFVDRVVAAAKAVLASGVRPNAPRLRDPMMEYAEILREPDTASDPALKPLIAEMAKQAALLLARKAAVVETDLHADDPEHEARLAAVRTYMAGKSLGFAGSRRGIHSKVGEFERALGAREVVWPDVEKQHAVGPLIEALKDCDVVCLIVRFCRHSYKDALDKAKKGGARLVFLPRGLGLNTVVYELYTQLKLDAPTETGEGA